MIIPHFCFPGSESPEDSGIEEQPIQHEQHSIPIPTTGVTNSLTSQRFWTLMKIRFLIKVRNTTALVFQILIPIILVIVGCVLSKQGTTEDTSFTKPVTMNSLYSSTTDPPFIHMAGIAFDSSFNPFLAAVTQCYMHGNN